MQEVLNWIDSNFPWIDAHWKLIVALGGILGGLFGWIGGIVATGVSIWAKFKQDKSASELQSRLKRHEFRFTKLHEKRADAIEEIYKALMVLSVSGQGHIIGSKTDSKRREEFLESKRKFDELIESNRIYFDTNIYKDLVSFSRTLQSGSIAKECVSEIPQPHSDVEKREIYEKVMKNWELASKEIPKLVDALISEFHKLLGVTED